jgi:hypothetical protein
VRPENNVILTTHFQQRWAERCPDVSIDLAKDVIASAKAIDSKSERVLLRRIGINKSFADDSVTCSISG